MKSIREYIEALASRFELLGALWLRARWTKAKLLTVYSDFNYAQRLFAKRGEAWQVDAPVTYNDKLWYLKLSNRDPLLVECSDKHAVRAYVERCGLAHILKREYAAFATAEEVDLDTLPSPSYLKCSHGSGLNWVYRAESTPSERRMHMRQFRYILRQNPYVLSREWNYKHITPSLICEEYLETRSGTEIPELQFFCFHGKTRMIMYNLGLADSTGAHQTATRWVFTPDFRLVDIRTSMPTSPDVPRQPAEFAEMMRCAEILAAPFPHVRVDLFNVDGRIYFNELTFYSGGGFVKLEPSEWQSTFGSWLDVDLYSIADDARRGGVRRALESFSLQLQEERAWK